MGDNYMSIHHNKGLENKDSTEINAVLKDLLIKYAQTPKKNR